jgi:hypothetical protein
MEAHSSGVSWPAVVAGAFVTAALSLALLALGTGIGFSGMSPLADGGVAAARIGRTAIGWLIVMQIIASAAGGYLAGRLRTRWVHVHTHEVFFRDTAHGFLVWAVSLVISAGLLTSAAIAVSGGAVSRQSAVPNGYFVDKLLRPGAPGFVTGDNLPAQREINVILANGVRTGGLPAADRAYLAQVVTARTGVGPADAERRVDDTFSETQDAAEKARAAVAHSMYWMFLALLVGAFSASAAATVGGRERDHVVMVGSPVPA